MSPQQQGPTKFGDYYLMDKIAVGGMAEIWRGKTIGLEGFERTVALKLILPSYTQNPEFNSMFVDEARIASTLSHSNIVRITNFGVLDGRYYHEEEFIEGRSVRQMMQKCHDTEKMFPIDSACYFVSEVCKGLHYAHTKHDSVTNETLNIVHRDMSPQNIMISFEGEVKIIDWGIAKAKGKMEETRAGVLKGKFGYMSPEQAEGEELDNRSDIFSLGIVFYEAITGERLFVADNEINTLKKIREGSVPLPSKVNPAIDKELEAISLKMLARPRIERYQSCYDVHEDILRYLHKKFPAYNSLKLSKFIRDLFSSEILADRKRMSEKEQSMPSYSPLSFGSRPYEERTRVSTSDSSSYKDVVDSGGADRTLAGGAKKTSEDNEPTMATSTMPAGSAVSSPSIPDLRERTESSAPRPMGDGISQLSYDRSAHEMEPNRKKVFIRFALVAVIVIVVALIFLMPSSKKTEETPKQVAKEEVQQPLAEQKPIAEQPQPQQQPPVAEERQAVPQPKEIAQAREVPKPQPEEEVKEIERSREAQQQRDAQQQMEAQQQRETQQMQPRPQPQAQNFEGKVGNLTLSSEPVNAEVLIDGQSRGRTPLTIKGLNLGKRYELAMRAEGFETATKFFTLRRESNSLTLPLAPGENSSRSFISIDSQPPSQVFIDGKLAGNFKSVFMFEVAPGTHMLRFVNEKLHIDYSTDVKVSRGEHIKKNITLR